MSCMDTISCSFGQYNKVFFLFTECPADPCGARWPRKISSVLDQTKILRTLLGLFKVEGQKLNCMLTPWPVKIMISRVTI